MYDIMPFICYIDSYKNEDDKNIITNSDYVINLFIDFFDNIKESEVRFDGDGNYIGKQISIKFNDIIIEVNYQYDKILIYDSNVDLLYVKAYIDITRDHDRFIDLQNSLYGLLGRVFGLPVSIELPF